MDNKLARKIREAESAKGCLITITTFNPNNKGNELDHWYLTKNFPRLDIQKSIDQVRKMLKAEEVQLSTSYKKKDN